MKYIIFPICEWKTLKKCEREVKYASVVSSTNVFIC